MAATACSSGDVSASRSASESHAMYESANYSDIANSSKSYTGLPSNHWGLLARTSELNEELNRECLPVLKQSSTRLACCGHILWKRFCSYIKVVRSIDRAGPRKRKQAIMKLPIGMCPVFSKSSKKNMLRASRKLMSSVSRRPRVLGSAKKRSNSESEMSSSESRSISAKTSFKLFTKFSSLSCDVLCKADSTKTPVTTFIIARIENAM